MLIVICTDISAIVTDQHPQQQDQEQNDRKCNDMASGTGPEIRFMRDHSGGMDIEDEHGNCLIPLVDIHKRLPLVNRCKGQIMNTFSFPIIDQPDAVLLYLDIDFLVCLDLYRKSLSHEIDSDHADQYEKNSCKKQEFSVWKTSFQDFLLSKRSESAKESGHAVFSGLSPMLHGRYYFHWK